MRTTTGTQTLSTRTRVALWTIQGLLAALFLFAGVMKLLPTSGANAQPSPFPPLFLELIGLAEVAGALGLILPGITGIRRGLTALAAAGLVIIMAGATAVTVSFGQVGGAAVPFAVGALCALVAYKRRPATAATATTTTTAAAAALPAAA